jgi:hypothetical protein
MHARGGVFLALGLALTGACSRQTATAPAQPSGHQFQTASGQAAPAARDGEWPMATHEYANRRLADLMAEAERRVRQRERDPGVSLR